MYALSIPWRSFTGARGPRIISFHLFAEQEKLQNILVGGSKTLIEYPKEDSRRGDADPIAAAGSLWRPGSRDMHSYGEKKKEGWQRMDAKGGGGAMCQCLYRRSPGLEPWGEKEKTGKSGGIRIAAAGREGTRLGRWSEVE